MSCNFHSEQSRLHNDYSGMIDIVIKHIESKGWSVDHIGPTGHFVTDVPGKSFHLSIACAGCALMRLFVAASYLETGTMDYRNMDGAKEIAERLGLDIDESEWTELKRKVKIMDDKTDNTNAEDTARASALLDLIKEWTMPEEDTVHLNVMEIIGPQNPEEGQLFRAQIVTERGYRIPRIKIDARFRFIGMLEEVMNVGGDISFKINNQKDADSVSKTLDEIQKEFDTFISAAQEAIKAYPEEVKKAEAHGERLGAAMAGARLKDLR